MSRLSTERAHFACLKLHRRQVSRRLKSGFVLNKTRFFLLGAILLQDGCTISYQLLANVNFFSPNEIGRKPVLTDEDISLDYKKKCIADEFLGGDILGLCW